MHLTTLFEQLIDFADRFKGFLRFAAFIALVLVITVLVLFQFKIGNIEQVILLSGLILVFLVLIILAFASGSAGETRHDMIDAGSLSILTALDSAPAGAMSLQTLREQLNLSEEDFARRWARLLGLRQVREIAGMGLLDDQGRELLRVSQMGDRWASPNAGQPRQ